jgi:TrmH family RNA methyltransferase
MTVDWDITSHSNPRIKRLLDLADRRHRDEEGVFVIEGPSQYETAIAAGWAPIEVYVDGTVPVSAATAVRVRPDVLDRVSYRGRSQGLVAVFAQRARSLETIQPSDPALVLVTEGLEKPGNLGAILRTAAAAGADAVVSVSGRVDVFNPNVLRASVGAALTVPVVETGIEPLRVWLEGNGLSLVAATPGAALPYWEADLEGPVALLVGAEDRGLTRSALDASSTTVAVPMKAGPVDSLNASVVMALLAYECLRQRRSP